MKLSHGAGGGQQGRWRIRDRRANREVSGDRDARHGCPGGVGTSTVLLLDYRLKGDASCLTDKQRRLIVRARLVISGSVRLLPSPAE